jgi:hypothetical protein
MRRVKRIMRITLRNSCDAIRSIKRPIARFRRICPRLKRRRWPGNGAWPFAFDPALNVDEYPAIWLPHLHPSTLVLGPPLAGQKGVDTHPLLQADGLAADRSCGTMRYLVLQSHYGTLRIALPSDIRLTSLAATIPIDGHFALRFCALTRLKAHVDDSVPLPKTGADSPSRYQRYRLDLLLQILDILARPGTSARHVAMHAIYPGQNLGRAIEWKGSSQRRQTFRLIREARQMMMTGYYHLLKCSS